MDSERVKVATKDHIFSVLEEKLHPFVTDKGELNLLMWSIYTDFEKWHNNLLILGCEHILDKFKEHENNIFGE